MPSVTSNLLLSASVSDISFPYDQTCHSENRCDFVCCFRLTSSTHLVYSTLFWPPPIGTSWLMRVPRIHLNLPLSSTSAAVFQSYTVFNPIVHLSLLVIKRLPDTVQFLVLRSHCFQDLPIQKFNRYVVWPRITSQP